MKIFKRIFTSLIRRPYQGLFILLIVFVLGNVLFASIAIQQSSAQVKEEMRSRIQGEITITYNSDIRHANEVAIYNMRDFVKEVENVPQSYEYKMWKLMDIDSEDNYLYIEKLIGAPTVDDLLGEYDLIDGRSYTKDDFESDSFKIVLTYPVANYKVGDVIRVPMYDYNFESTVESWRMKTTMYVHDYVDFEIIGIANGYKHVYDENFASNFAVVPLSYLDKMEVMQQDLFNQLPENKKTEVTQFIKDHLNWYRTCGYFVSDLQRMSISTEGISEIERLEKEIKEHDKYARSCYVFRSSTTDYLYVQAPLENLEALSNVTLWSSVVLVITILSLVSVLFIRTRKYEIGILLSLGASKLKVVLQFVLEVMLVGLLATSCAMVTGNKLGEVISNEFLQMQIDTDAEMLYEKEQGDVVTQLDMLESYTMELDSEYILTIYLASTGVLLISSMLPMVYIICMKPKKIMLNS
ncbi:MAG: FtsX-like permease family protein [Erysipelotrichaceae bacterium]|nr:FtsX-like permease family protein [Erysipelotrichaceae bacterium]